MSDGYAPENVKFFTYAKLMNMDEGAIFAIQPDYIVLDEFHRCGSEMWGQGIQNLLAAFPNTPIMGLSATAIRYLDNRRNMSDEIVNERFRVIDEVRDCIALFDKLNDTLTASWDLMYDAAKAYYYENGDLDVPKRYVTPEGFTLGSWLNTQRLVHGGKTNGILTEVQIAKLNEIGMRWESVRDLAWERNYAAAKAYYDEQGDLLVNVSDKTYHGVALGRWIAQLRSYRKNGIQSGYLTEERVALLERIGFVWDGRHTTAWEKSYQAAIEYKNKHGNLDIPVAYITDDGLRLGRWIRHQREAYYTTLSDARKKKLDQFGMVWEKADPWEQKFQLVKRYYDEHGDINIPGDYVSDNVWIARWLSEQVARMNGKPTGRAKTVKKLKSLGIRENTSRNDLAWEEQYRAAQSFYQNNGHLLIPKTYVSESGKSVGRWIQTQRTNRKQGKLTEKQVGLLNAIGMVWSVVTPHTTNQNYTTVV